MAELVPEDVASTWGLKTHGLMKDVLLQDGEDQQGHRPGLQETACFSQDTEPQLSVTSSSCWKPMVSVWT